MGVSVIRRVLATALVAAVVAVIVGGVSLARAGGGGARDFVLQEKQTSSTFVPVNPKAAAGNEFMFHSKLSKAGVQVGTLDVLCVALGGNQAQCSGTVRLSGGTLAISALVPLSGHQNPLVSIVGGTGRFDRARGQVRTVQHTQ